MKRRHTLPKVLRVMAEYCSSGIWVVEPHGVFRHGMVAHRSLGLPQDLAQRFDAWITDYLLAIEAPERYDEGRFVETGRELARQLKTFVGPEVRVLYAAESDIKRDEEISL